MQLDRLKNYLQMKGTHMSSIIFFSSRIKSIHKINFLRFLAIYLLKRIDFNMIADKNNPFKHFLPC